MAEERRFTPIQAACLSDGLGRGSIIDIIYEHPEGVDFQTIKASEDKIRARLYADIPEIFHSIPEYQLKMFLVDLVDGAELATLEDGLYNLVPWFRNFLDAIMKRARKLHPEMFTETS